MSDTGVTVKSARTRITGKTSDAGTCASWLTNGRGPKVELPEKSNETDSCASWLTARRSTVERQKPKEKPTATKWRPRKEWEKKRDRLLEAKETEEWLEVEEAKMDETEAPRAKQWQLQRMVKTWTCSMCQVVLKQGKWKRKIFNARVIRHLNTRHPQERDSRRQLNVVWRRAAVENRTLKGNYKKQRKGDYRSRSDLGLAPLLHPIAPSDQIPREQRAWTCPYCGQGLASMMNKYMREISIRAHLGETHPEKTMAEAYNDSRRLHPELHLDTYKKAAAGRQRFYDMKFEKIQAEFAKNNHQVEKADSCTLWHPKKSPFHACVKCRRSTQVIKAHLKRTGRDPPCPGWVDYETTKDIPQRITWHRWKAKGEDALKDAAAFYRMTDAEVQSRNDEEAGLNRDLLERERIRSGGGTPMHHLPGILKKAHARWYANQKKNPKGGRKNKPPTKEAKRKIKMVRNVPRSPESTRIWRKERRRKRSESDEAWQARLLAENGNNHGWSVAKDEHNTGWSKANEAPAEKTSTTRRGMEKLTGASPSEAIRAQQKGSEGGKTPSSEGAQAGQKVEGGDSDLGAGGGPPLGTPIYPEALDGKKKTKPKAPGQIEKVKETRNKSGRKRQGAARAAVGKAAGRKGKAKEEGKRPSWGAA